MKKIQWLRWVNGLLFIAVAVQILTVLFRGQLPFKIFFYIHTWCGRALLTLAAVHLILNWSWVRINFLHFPKKPRTT